MLPMTESILRESTIYFSDVWFAAQGGYGSRERKAGPSGSFALNRDNLASCACSHLRGLVGHDVKVAGLD